MTLGKCHREIGADKAGASRHEKPIMVTQGHQGRGRYSLPRPSCAFFTSPRAALLAGRARGVYATVPLLRRLVELGHEVTVVAEAVRERDAPYDG